MPTAARTGKRNKAVSPRAGQRRNADPTPTSGSLSILAAMDGYQNALASLGNASPLLSGGEYVRSGITSKPELLTILYRESWIVKKIIDTVSEDMTRSWYDLHTQLTPDRLTELHRLEARHNIRGEITSAMKWARLYGGAAALMVIKGQEDMLDQPLDMDMLMPGCFRGLIVLDRWAGIQPGLTIVDDMDDVDFGLPAYYEVRLDSMGGKSVRIHHSRLLRFVGRTLPPEEEELETYWGASEIEHIYEELCKRNATSANIAQLIFQANLRVFKMSDFGEMLATATPKQQAALFAAIQTQNRLMSSSGVQIMSANDSMEQHQYTFSGISDVYETFMLDMAGAAEIPATKLFGRAPAGMNATGESDLVNYYESILQHQEEQLRPALERLLPVMCMSLWGQVPDDLEVEFNPVRAVSAADRAQIGSQLTQAITAAYTAGVVSQRAAMAELREACKDIGLWGQITDQDIEAADDTLDAGEEAEPGGLLGGLMSGEAEADQRTDAGEGPASAKLAQADADGEWKSSEHPRDEDGQFAKTEGAGTKSESSSPKPAVTPNLSSLSAKHQKRSHEVSNAIAKGRAPLREKDGVNKHLPNNKEYRAHAAEMAAQGKPPPSYFTVDPKELVPIIQEKLRKREATYQIIGSNEVHIQLDIGKKIGMTYGQQEKSPHETNIITIRYSDKYGYHFYPDDLEARQQA